MLLARKLHDLIGQPIAVDVDQVHERTRDARAVAGASIDAAVVSDGNAAAQADTLLRIVHQANLVDADVGAEPRDEVGEAAQEAGVDAADVLLGPGDGAPRDRLAQCVAMAFSCTV